ncbi:Glucose-resistance amylase regulator [Limihaloglobus sulfuriphilus]|uniref:Glucose-resistance amylase regulator n=1 Tax=Limihaloglobus sulfuriphilus TaxID=1851148 RepID=A0A1Q2MFH0_9BACT|nr:LacI family DNA-binding transcriptional regulator [Limihaloglobus sulfuriphilus]AQQ71037.1 Glucose-resistance amylase regulator [Limihaloglobus sulfuriphilus]
MAKNGKRVRQIDVANALGVHQTLVSAVLSGNFNNSTVRVSRDKVDEILNAAKKMGYKPNRAAYELRGGKSSVIGILMPAPSLSFISERQMRLIVLEQIANQRGYRMMIGHIQNPDIAENYVDDFISRSVEGVLCLQHELQGDKNSIVKSLSRIENVVYLGLPAGVEDAHCVTMDHCDGIIQAVHYLASKGRKRIALALAGKKFRPMIERMEGYKLGLANERMAFDPELIWVGPEKVVPQPEYMRSIYKKLVSEKKADAVIASNDDWAIMLMKHLHSRSIRVPEDVAVIGYDNLRVSAMTTPSLTTIDGREEAVGSKMINMLLDLIDKGSVDQKVVTVKPKLIPRESA